MAGAVTPLLFIGEPTHVEARQVRSAQEGSVRMAKGETVWVGNSDAELAYQILVDFGVEPEMAERQVMAAKDGLGTAFP